jgi:hypothetical protein
MCARLPLHLYDLRDRLNHGAPGTVVHFTVRREANAHADAVALRDRIQRPRLHRHVGRHMLPAC